MIILKPFPMGPLRDAIIRTVIKAEDIENTAAVTIFQFYTVEEIEDKRKDENPWAIKRIPSGILQAA